MAVVQFDIDGVLADFVKGFVRYGQQLGLLDGLKILSESDTTNLTYGTHSVVGASASQHVWENLLLSRWFWSELPAAVPVDTFGRINDLQRTHTVYFTTNRMGQSPKQQTEAWLITCGIQRPTVILTARKGEAALALGSTHSIEDKAGNAVYIAYASPKTSSYLLNRLYNRFDHDVLGSKVTRVETVDQFLDDIERTT